MSDTPDPRAIAAGLTDAQRRAIIRLKVGVWVQRKKVAREMSVLFSLIRCRAILRRGEMAADEFVCLTAFGAVVQRFVMQSMIVS